jgi:hypothetical protein
MQPHARLHTPSGADARPLLLAAAPKTAYGEWSVSVHASRTTVRPSDARTGGAGAAFRRHARNCAHARPCARLCRPPDHQEVSMKAVLLVSSALLAMASVSASAKARSPKSKTARSSPRTA